MIYIISDDHYFALGAQHLFTATHKQCLLMDCNTLDGSLTPGRFGKRDTLILATDDTKMIALVMALTRICHTQVIFVIDTMSNTLQKLIHLPQEDVLAKRLSKEAFLRRVNGEMGQRNNAPALTEREICIMDLLAQGTPPKQISSALSISIKTVCTHKVNALKKLGLNHLNACSVFIYGQLHPAIQ